jgi:hypothetical protein
MCRLQRELLEAEQGRAGAALELSVQQLCTGKAQESVAALGAQLHTKEERVAEVEAAAAAQQERIAQVRGPVTLLRYMLKFQPPLPNITTDWL